jgi:hypothetical protein
MINGYSNMSAPPRSTIRKVVRPVGKQIVFDMGRVGLGSSHNLKQPQYERDAIIQAWVEDFVSKHKAELDAVPRPTGFMVGSICEDVNAPLGDLMRRYLGVYHVCTDPILTVAILGRVSGLIYVPHRELRLTEDSFFNTIGFPAKYFPQFGSAS